MLAPILGLVLFLGQAAPATSPATAPAAQPQNVVVVVSTTQPTELRKPQTVIDAWEQTQFAKVFSGEKPLTLDDVKNPIFWFDTAKDLVITVLAFIPRLLGTLIFLFVFWLVYRGFRKIAMTSMKNSEVDTSIRDMLSTLIKWTVMGFGVVIACNQLGIPIVAMLTGVSIIGLAVGFAAQETLANFIAGIVIFLDKPFKVGDWIEVGGQQGSVRRITFRSTRFTNLDGDVVVIPNTRILSDQIINKTTNPITRVNVPIGIAYKESIDKARDVLLALFPGDKRVEKHPEPEVVVRACAASSVDLMIHFWIREERYEDSMVWEYLEKAKGALDAAGIEIPFPHLQVMLEKTEGLQSITDRLPGQSKN